MADSVALTAQERTDHGTRASRKLRKKGMVPAVVYGHKQATVSVSVPAEELARAIRQGARLIQLKQGSATESALIRDLQWDPLGHDILHVDFTRVSVDERITVDVRIELRGTSPGVTAGGVLNQPLHNLSIECLAVSIPDSIRVNIGELQIEQAIHVREIKLPEGAVVKNDPEAIVVQVTPPQDEEAELGEQAEPELIGRKAEKEEGEE